MKNTKRKILYRQQMMIAIRGADQNIIGQIVWKTSIKTYVKVQKVQ